MAKKLTSLIKFCKYENFKVVNEVFYAFRFLRHEN